MSVQDIEEAVRKSPQEEENGLYIVNPRYSAQAVYLLTSPTGTSDCLRVIQAAPVTTWSSIGCRLMPVKAPSSGGATELLRDLTAITFDGLSDNVSQMEISVRTIRRGFARDLTGFHVVKMRRRRSYILHVTR